MYRHIPIYIYISIHIYIYIYISIHIYIYCVHSSPMSLEEDRYVNKLINVNEPINKCTGDT